MESQYLDNTDYTRGFKKIEISPLFEDEIIISKRKETELQQFGDFKKYCYDRAKSQWQSPKPFNIHWGQKTSHLKKLSDWSFLKSVCDDAERRGNIWSKVFWGSLKPREQVIPSV